MSACSERDCGFAAAHGGKPLAYRHVTQMHSRLCLESEAQPQSNHELPERQSLSAVCCGKAAYLLYNAAL